MLNKLLNWIDYHRGYYWARGLLRSNWSALGVRTIVRLGNFTQAYSDGAMDATQEREMAR